MILGRFGATREEGEGVKCKPEAGGEKWGQTGRGAAHKMSLAQDPWEPCSCSRALSYLDPCSVSAAVCRPASWGSFSQTGSRKAQATKRFLRTFPWRNHFLKPTSSTPSGRIPGRINSSEALISPAVREWCAAFLRGHLACPLTLPGSLLRAWAATQGASGRGGLRNPR